MTSCFKTQDLAPTNGVYTIRLDEYRLSLTRLASKLISCRTRSEDMEQLR